MDKLVLSLRLQLECSIGRTLPGPGTRGGGRQFWLPVFYLFNSTIYHCCKMASGFFNLLSEYSSWVTALVSQSHFGVSHNVFDPAIACAGLERLLIPNVTILNAIYYDEPTNASTSELFDTISIDVPLCRLEFSITTSETSSVRAEAWLPSEWTGRFMAIGNGGLGGCEFCEVELLLRLNCFLPK